MHLKNLAKPILALLLFIFVYIGVNGVNLEQYSLKNGLKVILYKDNKFPEVIIRIAYNVGSAYEEKGQSGIAHINEHMMFNGTKTLKRDTIDELVKSSGGYSNAYTADDITNYYIILPSYNYEIGLRIESDRMANATMDEAVFKKEMKVIKQEKLMRYGNSPWGRFWTFFGEKFYNDFPYKHPTIGYDEDLNSINIHQVRNFYNTYYKPNNATLIISGDIKIKEAKELVDKYFAPLTASKIDKRTELKTPPLGMGYKKFLFEDPSFTMNYVMYTIPAPSYGDDDREPLLMAAAMLGNGNAAILKQKLVDTNIATSAWSSLRTGKVGKYLMVGASFLKKKDLPKIEKIIFDTFEELKKGKFSKKDLDRAKNLAEAENMFENERLNNISERLSILATYYKAGFINEETELIKKIKKGDIKNVAKKYLKKENIKRFLLSEKEKQPAAAGIKGEENPHFKEDFPIYFPKAGEIIKKFSYLRKVKTKTLKNGMKIIVLHDDSFPTTTFKISMKAGPSFNKDINGIPQIAIYLLGEGTKKYPKEKFDFLTDYNGIMLDFNAGYETLSIDGKYLTKYNNFVLDLLRDMLEQPLFEKDSIQRTKMQIYSSILAGKKDPKDIASIEFLKAVYGKDHPYAISDKGDENIVMKANKKMLMDFFKQNIIPQNIQFTIISSEKTSKIIKDIEKYFGDWDKKGKVNKLGKFKNVKIKKDEIALYVPNIQQSVVQIAYKGPDYNDKDNYYLGLVTNMLGGGSLTSILGKKVRRDAGLAYYVFCFSRQKASGGFIKIQSGVSPENVQKFNELVLKTLNELKKTGFSEKIVEKSKMNVLGNLVTGIDSNESIVGLLDNLYYSGKDINDFFDRLESLTKANKKQLDRVFKKYFTDNYKIVDILPEVKDENKNKK
ncbi:insulinase family protein [bacterium]|nr:insulinase family protein [bacterium]